VHQGGLKDLARVDQAGRQSAQADAVEVQKTPLSVECTCPKRLAAQPSRLGKQNASDIARVEQTLARHRRLTETAATEFKCAGKPLRSLRADPFAQAQIRCGIGGTWQALRRRTSTSLEQLLQEHCVTAKPKIELNLRPHTRKTQCAAKGDRQS
jgi:hypothetical protein